MTQSQVGTDAYSITETGSYSGSPYSEVLTGTDTYTLTMTGNTANQIYTRTIVGTGSYTLSETGGTETPGSSTYSYSTLETENQKAGLMSQSVSGTDRYGLLQYWNDVSNTDTGKDPGNMNFSPVGVPFVDPPPFGQVVVSLGASVNGQTSMLPYNPADEFKSKRPVAPCFSREVLHQIL